MKVSLNTLALSLLVSLSFNNDQRSNLAEAAKLRRGSVNDNDEIHDYSLDPSQEKYLSDERSLLSSGTVTDAEFLALKKTPEGQLASSKCGSSLFRSLRKYHPGCTRYKEDADKVPATLPPIDAPSNSPAPTVAVPTPMPSTLPSTTSEPTMLPTTPMPSTTPTQTLNCVQTVVGNELTIQISAFYRKGDVHCLISDEGGDAAYFGYNWSNQFGLFVNGQALWTAPETSVAVSDRWVFQQDGNLLLRDSGNQGIWRTHTGGNSGSQLKVSFERVWIETRSGNTVWFQPLTPLPTTAPQVEPPTTEPVNDNIFPTNPPTGASAMPSEFPTTLPSTMPSEHPTAIPTGVTPMPSENPTGITPSATPSTSFPTAFPTRVDERALNCVQTVMGIQLTIPSDTSFEKGDVHCLISEDGEAAYFGYTWTNQFGLFSNSKSVWTAPDNQMANFDRWSFQEDGNLVLRDAEGRSIWTSESYGNFGSHLRISFKQVMINRNTGYTLWSQPPYLGPPRPPPNDGYPDPNGTLHYYAYYYPWYLRNNWGRHGYQDEPLLGKYGTNEVAIAEQHIQWALETGISSWIISYWGPNHLTMKHFKQGMINAPSINKMKFCMLYESVILDDRGNWRDGSKENALYRDLKVIVDDFFDHPSYLKINGRPVIIFYITRSRMPFQEGFDGESVLANMRRRLGHDIYFIADEPFFNSWNKWPDKNGNGLVNGKQVFDAYTTYNMYLDDRVRDGETATTYQLREGMPIWENWAKKVPMFPNVMPQYYDFRGNKPLLGNSNDFMKQLREVACLPRTNFNGAPHIMMITSFNEWWEGTQIEPENGSSNNWNNYGFQFMETLAAFKKEVDSRGTHWCPDDSTAKSNNDNRD
ncbi:unnamed protein product [Cylindrotheca closterium]|uniref:Bulb-type lectin domain-containing protein n=1 Tax=Cylindrotheca closterium TaxID=2856 RepID=A0AAD2FLX8_9STRA|nr:unnamed protein product [Cylindrotheca closterium]